MAGLQTVPLIPDTGRGSPPGLGTRNAGGKTMTTTSSESTPLSQRRWQPHEILMSWSLIVIGLILLMSLPDFDPGGFRGSWFGTVLMGLWGSALLVWALGIARRGWVSEA